MSISFAFGLETFYCLPQMKDKGRLIIISAPSGTGKTTLIQRFLATHPNMIHSISCTTRPIRQGETNGKHYHFINEREFRDGIKRGKFAEWAKVHDHIYGTPKEPLDLWVAEGKDVLLDVDVIGGMNLKKMYGDRAISFFLLPPSDEELKRRLLGRNTDSKEQQDLRLKNALKEMTYKDKYDHQVVNDVLEDACNKIEEILETT